MKADAGGIDRALRAVLGIVLLALTLTGAIGAWGWIGLALLGYCPLYQALGFRTCPRERS